MSKGEQLSSTCVTALLPTSFISERFGAIKIFFKPHKPVSKSQTKNDTFDHLKTFSFFFLISSASNALMDGAEIPFSREKCSIMCSKINQSVKAP